MNGTITPSEIENIRIKLRQRLTPDKIERIRTLKNSELWQNTPDTVKSVVNLMYTIDPDLFKEPKIIEPKKSAVETAFETATQKAKQAEITMPEYAKSGTAQFLQTYGFLPQGYYEMSPGKKILSLSAYPLKKVLSILSSPQRTISAIAAESSKYPQLTGKLIQPSALEKPSTVESGKKQTFMEYLTEPLKEIPSISEIKSEILPAQKAVAKAGIKALFNMPGEYQDYAWNKAFQAMYPGTKFTQKFGWGQRFDEIAQDPAMALVTRYAAAFLSGLAGSPADIAGFATDILTNPLTYMGGGTAKGSRPLGRTPENIVNKETGKILIPKGTFYSASPRAARTFLRAKEAGGIRESVYLAKQAGTAVPATTTALQLAGESPLTSLIKAGIIDVGKATGAATGAGVVATTAVKTATTGVKTAKTIEEIAAEMNLPEKIANATETSIRLMKEGAKLSKKLPFYGSPIQLQNYWETVYLRDAIQKAASKLPYEEAIKLFDLGGLKLGTPFAGSTGKTVIPGYKFQQTILPKAKKAGEVTPIKQVQEMLRPAYGIPQELVPGMQISNWYGRKEITEASEILAKAIYETGLSKSELIDLAEYMRLLDGRRTVNEFLTANQVRQTEILGEQLQQSLFEAPPPKELTKLKKAEKALTERLKEYDTKIAEMTEKVADNPKVTQAQGYVRELFDKLYKDEAIFGKKYEYRPDYFPGIYTKKSIEEVTGKPLPKFKTSYLGTKKFTSGMEKKIDYLSAKEIGLVPEDFINAIKQRTSKSAVAIKRASALNEIKKFSVWDTKEKGFAKKMAEEGYVKISKNIAPELKDFYVPKEVEPVLNRFISAYFGDEALNEMLKIFDKGLTLWKRMALATPGFQFRNFWSDIQLGAFEYGYKYFEPKYWEAAKKVAQYGVTGEDGIIKLAGKEVKISQLYEEALTGGVNKAGLTRTEGKISPYAKVKELSPFEALTAIGEVREDVTRIVPFLIERDLGGDFVTASFNVRKIFIDYTDLTPTERNLFRRIIPFYTWIKKNIARQAELLVTQPGKYSFIPAAINLIESMGEDVENYEEYRAQYQKELGGILLPFKDPRTGQRLILNPNFAWQDWARLNPKEFLTSMRPLLKIPIELGLNKEIFSGAPTRTGDPIKAPQPLQSMLRHLPNSVLAWFGMKKNINNSELYMSPLAYYLYRQNPLFANIARIAPADPEAQDLYDFLSVTIGLKFWLYDEDRQKEEYFTNYSREINEALRSYRKMGYRLPEINEIEKGYRMIFEEEAKKKYNIADIENLILALKLSGASQTDINKLNEALTAPYSKEMEKLKGADIIELERLLREMGIVNPQEEFYRRFPEYQRIETR